MKISSHFNLEEFYISNTAKLHNINNMPDISSVINIVKLTDNCLEKIRSHFNSPLIITSGYRCKKLNLLVKGVSNSQHLTGHAADFYVKNFSLDEVFKWCKSNLNFDQLIFENSNKSSQWLHISYNFENNRHETLFYDGKIYKKI